MSESYSFDIGHPAPDRGQVGGWMLAFVLGGGAAAWALQICAISALTGAVCAFGGGVEPGSASASNWAQTAAGVVNVVALAISVLALVVSYIALTRTSHLSGESGIMDVGEGRTHFIAIWGILASILFFLAIGFNTISVFWGGLCHR